MVAEVAFGLKNAKCGEDGVVGEAELAREGVGDFLDGGVAFIPDDVHEANLCLGEVGRLFSRQGRGLREL